MGRKKKEPSAKLGMRQKWSAADDDVFIAEVARGGTREEIIARCLTLTGRSKRSLAARLCKVQSSPLTAEEERERVACVYEGWPPGSCLADVAILAHLERYGWSFPLSGFSKDECKRIEAMSAEKWVTVMAGRVCACDGVREGRARYHARVAEGGHRFGW